ncbi:hypothetical protein F5X99DRAFT_391624 [Biscogniauxia marginata]|nr:hypothetical protein F5X99DRAFT_391624 [Biscogniauxia marginata]
MDSEEKNTTSNTASSSVILVPSPAEPDSDSRLERAVSQRTSSVVIGFFTLPGETRNNIYRRALVAAHPLYLFQDAGPDSRVETFAPDRPFQSLALLHTSRQVYDEARAVLYGSNRFTLVDTTPHQVDLLQSFLNRIGAINAGLLSYLCINFPAVEIVEGQPGNVMLREDGLRSLKLLQQNCAGLKTLEILVHKQNSSGLTKASHDDSQSLRTALSQIDVQLRAISSLKKILVRFYDGPSSPLVTETMKGFGWVICLGDKGQ